MVKTGSMNSLKTVIIDINKLNKGDNLEALCSNISTDVTVGMREFIENSEQIDFSDCFLITDNREAAFYAKETGVGIAVYTNGDNNAGDYPEALYCIDNLSEMTEKTLNRIYQRSRNLPWEILKTKRCRVREITVEDVDRLYEIYSDEDVRKYIEDLYEDKEEEIQYTKDYIANQYRFYEYGMWIVEDIKSGEIIGRAGIFDRPNQEYQELGFVFAKEYWGEGYAFEVLTAVMDYVYAELGVETLYAHAVHENIRSGKILRKLGFEFDCESVVDGKVFDRFINKRCS